MSPAERQWAIEHLQQCHSPFTEIQADQLREVFPAIFSSNFNRVWDQLRKRGLAEEEAKELFQETFLTAFLKIVEARVPGERRDVHLHDREASDPDPPAQQAGRSGRGIGRPAILGVHEAPQ